MISKLGKEEESGPGEKAHESRALVALPEDAGSIPRTHMAAHNHM